MLALALAACQSHPQPFEDDNKAANPLLFLAGRGGILVMPIEGTPDPQALARAVAEELERREIPASTVRMSKETTSLIGAAKQRPFDASRDEIEIDWRYQDAAGKTVGTETGRWLVPGEAWRRADPGALLGLAMATGPSLAALVEGDRKGGLEQPRHVIVYPVDGAPGDGKTALKRAMESALERRKVKLDTEAVEGTLVVLGSVRISPAETGQERIQISWSVINNEGKSLGVIDQENTIPAGSLDGTWGDVAAAVADAAAGGLIELMTAISASAAE